MALRLIIMRHAQTENYSETGQDFRRNLTASGFDHAGKIGAFMQAERYIPQRILCSTANRTRQTLEAITPYFPSSPLPQIDYKDELYHAGTGDLLALLQQQEETTSPVMIIGHNPGLPQLITLLTGEPLHRYPPATLTVLETEANWPELGPGRMQLTRLQYSEGL